MRVIRESVWATASGEPSKSSGRQKRSREAKTRLRISGATLVVLMVDMLQVMSVRRYAKLTKAGRVFSASSRSDYRQPLRPASPRRSRHDSPGTSRPDVAKGTLHSILADTQLTIEELRQQL